jgi:hypothetical protein
MVISSYHVNNVLRVYGDQLRQSKLSNGPKNSKISSPDRLNISDKAKRKAIVTKIASEIIEKIANFGPQENVEEEVSKNLENEYGVQLDITRKSPNDLLFKVIDESGETLNSLSIENSEFLRYKLEEVNNKTGEKSQKSGSED